MFLWEKTVSARWLAAHEVALGELAESNLAVIDRPGKARSLVQITGSRKPVAQQLLRDFGGQLQWLSRNWTPQPTPAHPPIRIGSRLTILGELRGAPPKAKESQNELIIPAAGAFGTGEHATTAMSLRLLEETTRKLPNGWRMLDAGTGSGILALAARRFGAGAVIGLDNDPRAIKNARDNARLNRLGKTQFLCADVLRWKIDHRYDVITANLFSELLIAALPRFARNLSKDGRLIVSGILREQVDEVTAALPKAGLVLLQKRRRGKWIALRAGHRSRSAV